MSLDGAIAKLDVVAEVIESVDYPGAHQILVKKIEDLATLRAAVMRA